jgi:hypothetical protein
MGGRGEGLTQWAGFAQGGSRVTTSRTDVGGDVLRGERDGLAATEGRRFPLIHRSDTALLVLATASILVAAVILRLVALGKIGFNSDEAVYSGQAAALAGDEELGRYFSPFRAHPLLVQTLLAVLFRVVGVSDVAARTLVALAFGVGGIAAAIFLARRLYGWGVALIAGLILALVPYHVILSRQVMLDVALAMGVTLTLLATYRYFESGRTAWLLLSASLAGLATLAKETGILLIPVMLLFLLWVGRLRRLKLRYVVSWGTLYTLTVLPFAATRLLFETGTTHGFFLYQVSREPNHAWWYFPIILWESLGPPVVVTALVGLIIMAVRRRAEDKLVLSWLFIFGTFFQVWPTKLFPYLIAIAPALTIASAIGVLDTVRLATRALRPIWTRILSVAATIVLGATLVPPSLLAATEGVERYEGPFSLDVEVQDFAGGREVGRWVGENTPEGSVFLTIGPSMGNLLSFYGQRDWFALSVNRDPTKRNPAYRPIVNPDLEIRQLQIHYAVWDAYSADRSAFFNASLMRTVRSHGGTPVFAAWLGAGRQVKTGRALPPGVQARVVVYSLPGGDPTGASSAPVS